MKWQELIASYRFWVGLVLIATALGTVVGIDVPQQALIEALGVLFGVTGAGVVGYVVHEKRR